MRENGIDGAAGVPFLFVIRYILGLDERFLYSMQNPVISMVTSQTFWKKNHVCKSIIEYLNDTEEILVLSMRHVNSI